MSHHLRSAAMLLESSCIAGPSRLRQLPLRTHHLYPSQMTQRRTIKIPPFLDRFVGGGKTEPKEGADLAAEGKSLGPGRETAGTTGSLFDEIAASLNDAPALEKAAKAARVAFKWRKPAKKHVHKSNKQPVSPHKLKLLSHQIAGLPVDEAILQMQFSNKRPARWIKTMLETARDEAIDRKSMDRSKLVIAESWIGKDIFGPKKTDYKSRGRFGIRRKPYARLTTVLKEGKTREEKQQIKFAKIVSRVRSAGIVREDGKLRRKVISDWAW